MTFFPWSLFQYAELFDKVDVTREGTVDWDKFASHMLLEFYEKDDIFSLISISVRWIVW